jgi:CRISPR-associated protein Csx17
LYLPDAVVVNGAAKRISADPRITAILRAGDVQRAVQIAVDKLRIAGLRPIHGAYYGGMDARRLGAALLIPTYGFRHAILQDEEREAVS